VTRYAAARATEGRCSVQAVARVQLTWVDRRRFNGRWIRSLLDDVATTLDSRHLALSRLSESYASLSDALSVLDATTDLLLARIGQAPEDVLAGATSHLDVLGVTLSGWLLIRRADRIPTTNGRGNLVSKRETTCNRLSVTA
jgi:hypothetical protein